jgi:predicted HAD superfamily phosphohydrolase YqeG
VRATYERVAGLADALRRAGEMSAKTLVFDIEPLVAYWENGQEALDQGVADVLRQAAAVAGVRTVCFATNSVRRPSVVPGHEGVRVVYLASAGKPLRTGLYRGFPRPGVVIGDQVVTDGVLARRLGYAFLWYCPGSGRVPAGPRLMGWCGRLVRPLLFTRPG